MKLLQTWHPLYGKFDNITPTWYLVLVHFPFADYWCSPFKDLWTCKRSTTQALIRVSFAGSPFLIRISLEVIFYKIPKKGNFPWSIGAPPSTAKWLQVMPNLDHVPLNLRKIALARLMFTRLHIFNEFSNRVVDVIDCGNRAGKRVAAKLMHWSMQSQLYQHRWLMRDGFGALNEG